jgi:hypothetical protein
MRAAGAAESGVPACTIVVLPGRKLAHLVGETATRLG